MAVHLNQISDRAKELFIDATKGHRDTLNLFYEGYKMALEDVNRNWYNAKQAELKIVKDEIRDEVKKLCVSVSEGGENENGMTLHACEKYIGIVNRAIQYHVPVYISQSAKKHQLVRAKNYVDSQMKDYPGTQMDKMIVAYDWVKQQELNEHKEIVMKVSTETPFTLPNPRIYTNTTDLLNDGIKSMLAWLHTKLLQEHLGKPLKEAKILKKIQKELTAYEDGYLKIKTGT